MRVKSLKMSCPRLLLFLTVCNTAKAFLPPSTDTCRNKLVALSVANDSCKPPAFTIEDDDDDTVPRNSNIPPDFTIEDDDDEEHADSPVSITVGSPDFTMVNDDYSEQVSKRPRRPKRPKRKKIEVTNMAGTSWMEKNTKFSGQEAQELPNPQFSEKTDRRFNHDINSAKSFRQDFRGTRVFVQGIPPGASWQDLKDHFKRAGDVVFASVSIDVQTGQSKGHGIVQFETTEMANNAIQIMRNYPLNGSPLFVRMDVQEGNSNAKLRSVPKGPTPPTKWKCANEENVAYMSEEEISNIRTLIKQRDEARRSRKYEISDRIRDELKENHGVFIDDRLKMWWTSVDGSKVPQTIQDIKGGGRWKLKPWRQIPTTPENDACVSRDLVEGLLKQRDVARREKDFSTADALLEEARTSPDGDITLRIHDESRTWRVWTAERPPQEVEHRIVKDPGQAREDAARECFSIVKEFAPAKIEEIETVLKKFPGREFQILKRLKKQYL